MLHIYKNSAEVRKKVLKLETCCTEFVTSYIPKRHQKIHDENSYTNCQHFNRLYCGANDLNKHIFDCTASSRDLDDFKPSFTSQQNKFELQNLIEREFQSIDTKSQNLKIASETYDIEPKTIDVEAESENNMWRPLA